MFSGREEDFYVWAKEVENCVSGVFPNVRGALTFAERSKHEAERFVTPRRRRPDGIGAFGKGKGKQCKGKHGQGQRQREARTARTTRTGKEQGQGQERGFD